MFLEKDVNRIDRWMEPAFTAPERMGTLGHEDELVRDFQALEVGGEGMV